MRALNFRSQWFIQPQQSDPYHIQMCARRVRQGGVGCYLMREGTIKGGNFLPHYDNQF